VGTSYQRVGSTQIPEVVESVMKLGKDFITILTKVQLPRGLWNGNGDSIDGRERILHLGSWVLFLQNSISSGKDMDILGQTVDAGTNYSTHSQNANLEEKCIDCKYFISNYMLLIKSNCSLPLPRSASASFAHYRHRTIFVNRNVRQTVTQNHPSSPLQIHSWATKQINFTLLTNRSKHKIIILPLIFTLTSKKFELIPKV